MNYLRNIYNYLGGNIQVVDIPIPQIVVPRTYRSIITERMKKITEWLMPMVPKYFRKKIKTRAREIITKPPREIIESPAREPAKEISTNHIYEKESALRGF